MGAQESHSSPLIPLSDIQTTSTQERVFLKKVSQKLDFEEEETIRIKSFLESKGYSFTNRLLGKTSATKILRATSSDGRKVAIKILKCNNMKDYEKNQNEFNLMKLFYSDHIIKVQDLLEYRTETKMIHFLIIERCLYDLYSQLQLIGRGMSHPDIYKISLDLVKGLRDIHEKNTVHLDIKPHNVVLGTDNKWKFIDMGISNKLNSSDGHVSTIKGLTLNYCSPEQYQQFYGIGKAKANKQSDIFSLGLLFLKLTGIEIPKEEVEKTKQLNFNYMSLSNPKFFEYNKLINQMLSYQPEYRPSLSEIEESLNKINNSKAVATQSPLKLHRKNNSQTTLTSVNSKPTIIKDEMNNSFFVYKKISPMKSKKDNIELPSLNTSLNNLDIFSSPSKSSLTLPKMSYSDPRNKSSQLIYLKPSQLVQKLTLPKISQKQSYANIFSNPINISQ